MIILLHESQTTLTHTASITHPRLPQYLELSFFYYSDSKRAVADPFFNIIQKSIVTVQFVYSIIHSQVYTELLTRKFWPLLRADFQECLQYYACRFGVFFLIPSKKSPHKINSGIYHLGLYTFLNIHKWFEQSHIHQETIDNCICAVYGHYWL